ITIFNLIIYLIYITEYYRKNNIIKNSTKIINYKLINKSLNYLSLINKRKYSTVIPVNNKSERLDNIIKELGINPIFIYENLDSDDIRKQVLNDTRGLSGIYMILNKVTKDYYIGSASTNRIYA